MFLHTAVKLFFGDIDILNLDIEILTSRQGVFLLLDELEEQLNQLGITKDGYAEFVAKNYNQIRLGNKPLSLILAVLLENINHIAAIHLHYDKNENFWLVTTVHAIKLHDLEKIPLIWERK